MFREHHGDVQQSLPEGGQRIPYRLARAYFAESIYAKAEYRYSTHEAGVQGHQLPTDVCLRFRRHNF
jgi:hypothetical protein